jgi:hypothetical protein
VHTPKKKEKVNEGGEDEDGEGDAPADDGDGAEGALKPVLQKDIYPESVISLRGDD